jgi:hypothetical protein
MQPRKLFLALVAIAASLAIGASARAQVYPSRSITMIVPFPAGGPTDTIGRVMAQRMKASLGLDYETKPISSPQSESPLQEATKKAASCRVSYDSMTVPAPHNQINKAAVARQRRATPCSLMAFQTTPVR